MENMISRKELEEKEPFQFSQTEQNQIEKRGATLEKVNNQIAIFKKGAPYANLIEAATKEKGIKVLDKETMISYYNQKNKSVKKINFVPASGAATRMFKDLFAYLEGGIKTDAVIQFLTQINKFPFHNNIAHKEKLSEKELIAYVLLNKEGLNFGNLPKGLIPFHKYDDGVKTAFQEHFYEALYYANNNNELLLHFTISEEHLEGFNQELNRFKEAFETEHNVSCEVDYSFQKKSTDTIAVNIDNTPFLNNGELLFRPGGHGALIENLNDINADIIFIKNIDNVALNEYALSNASYKKMLAGKLLEVQEKAFKYLEQIFEDKTVEEALIQEIRTFAQSELNVVLPKDFNTISLQERIDFLSEKINRPIRVCGMVKNEGEPGGGPFWVADNEGNVSLQIVESAQIDIANEAQLAILQGATHFNPVDIVCGVKDYKGDKFNLLDFIDNTAVFISEKSKNGKQLKALELPGLWNGAMAYWNTIFVEVPLTTFNPVKTINDLLKPAHLGK